MGVSDEVSPDRMRVGLPSPLRVDGQIFLTLPGAGTHPFHADLALAIGHIIGDTSLHRSSGRLGPCMSNSNHQMSC